MKPDAPPEKEASDTAISKAPNDRVSRTVNELRPKRAYTLSDTNARGPSMDESGGRFSGPASSMLDPLSIAERGYLELCEERSGLVVDCDDHAKNRRRRDKLIAQSIDIGEKLESVGIKAFNQSKIAIVGLCSGTVVELIDFRNIVFIPVIAQRKRASTLQQLEYFIDQNPYSRMWVFTSGVRTKLGDVKERTKEMHRRLSKLNYQPFMKKAGIQIVFRSSELGEMERDEEGNPTFHIHAHCIIHLKRKIGKNNWSELLSRVRGWWKFHFKDSKKIDQAREACKYVVKPEDLDKLEASELGALHHQLFKLHLVQCLGILKDQKQAIEDNKSKLVRQKTSDGCKLSPIKKWDTKGRRIDVLENYDKPIEDLLVARLIPAPYFTNVSEPAAIIMNHTGKRFRDIPQIQRAIEAALPKFNTAKEGEF